jgi:hypothetical protein
MYAAATWSPGLTTSKTQLSLTLKGIVIAAM